RVIKVYIINNPDVTDKQLADMGLPIYKTTRTPSKVETRSPYMKVILTEPRVLTVEFYESEDKKAKPEGQRGVKFVYILSDERPTDISQLINSESDTRTPVNLSFTEEERGKTLWFAARWENTRVKYGPWSEIFSAIVP
ncbi:MAG: hypothetical protein LBS54_01720, partial [Dysgonamonadaceae bacterium]|nr:hypothetical protein [Dysgonamonadaceae bacterium]